jgi:hypothetical protein
MGEVERAIRAALLKHPLRLAFEAGKRLGMSKSEWRPDEAQTTMLRELAEAMGVPAVGGGHDLLRRLVATARTMRERHERWAEMSRHADNTMEQLRMWRRRGKALKEELESLASWVGPEAQEEQG